MTKSEFFFRVAEIGNRSSESERLSLALALLANCGGSLDPEPDWARKAADEWMSSMARQGNQNDHLAAIIRKHAPHPRAWGDLAEELRLLRDLETEARRFYNPSDRAFTPHGRILSDLDRCRGGAK